MKTLTLEQATEWMENVLFESSRTDAEFWGNFSDALFYLQQYRHQIDDLERTKKMCFAFVGWKMIEAEKQGRAVFCPNCGEEYIVLPESNAPLSWDELKQMEGKPVWVEGEHGCIWNQKAWSLIWLDAENEDIIICVSTDNGVHYEFAIDKEDYGSDWQAYRKERE